MEGKTGYIGLSLDFLHSAHTHLIEIASKNVDRLVLGVLSDKAILSRKTLPLLTMKQRQSMAKGLKGIDEVIIQDEWSYVNNIRKLRPDKFFHGDDWKISDPALREEVINALNSYGGELIEIPYDKTIASSLSRVAKTNYMGSYARTSLLKRLIESKSFVRIIETHNPMSAIIGETTKHVEEGTERRFDGFWSSSLTDSTSMGLPDIEVLDFSRRINNINAIFDVTTNPLVYDADTGGIAEHFAINVKSLERIGVSAVIIEDKTGLKKNSLLGNEVEQTQDSIESFSEKIRMGCEAKENPDFMIIARIESLILETGMQDALERASAYVKAGADGIMIHSRRKTPDEVFEFAKKFRESGFKTPLVVVPTSYASVTEDELERNGINVVIYANQMLRSAYPAMLETARSILSERSAESTSKKIMSIKDILKLIPGTI